MKPSSSLKPLSERKFSNYNLLNPDIERKVLVLRALDPKKLLDDQLRQELALVLKDLNKLYNIARKQPNSFKVVHDQKYIEPTDELKKQTKYVKDTLINGAKERYKEYGDCFASIIKMTALDAFIHIVETIEKEPKSTKKVTFAQDNLKITFESWGKEDNNLEHQQSNEDEIINTKRIGGAIFSKDGLEHQKHNLGPKKLRLNQEKDCNQKDLMLSYDKSSGKDDGHNR